MSFLCLQPQSLLFHPQCPWLSSSPSFYLYSHGLEEWREFSGDVTQSLHNIDNGFYYLNGCWEKVVTHVRT